MEDAARRRRGQPRLAASASRSNPTTIEVRGCSNVTVSYWRSRHLRGGSSREAPFLSPTLRPPGVRSLADATSSSPRPLCRRQSAIGVHMPGRRGGAHDGHNSWAIGSDVSAELSAGIHGARAPGRRRAAARRAGNQPGRRGVLYLDRFHDLASGMGLSGVPLAQLRSLTTRRPELRVEVYEVAVDADADPVAAQAS